MELLNASERQLKFSSNDEGPMSSDQALATIEAAFFSSGHPDTITVDAGLAHCLAGILVMETTECKDGELVAKQRVRIKREDFLQCAPAWLRAPRVIRNVEPYVTSGLVRHPQRPCRPVGLVYSRRIPHLSSELGFRGLSPELDTENLHAWMNNERVNASWGMRGPPEVHRQLLQALLADKHAQPLIGEFDRTPFGYFDVYWAKEDKVGQYYDAADYDRGLHMLVGEDRFRGAHRVEAWLASLVHYAFLDEPRTQQLVCEPRIDNERMIAYLLRFGFTPIGFIDFPHKKAILMRMTKDTFLKRGMRLDRPSPEPRT